MQTNEAADVLKLRAALVAEKARADAAEAKLLEAVKREAVAEHELKKSPRPARVCEHGRFESDCLICEGRHYGC